MSTFLDLPPELRVRIYRLCITDNRNRMASDVMTLSLYNTYTGHGLLQPAISRVSRLLRQESLPIFYASMHFVVHAHYPPKRDNPHIDRLFQWVRSLGDANAAHVGNLRLVLNEVELQPVWETFKLPGSTTLYVNWQTGKMRLSNYERGRPHPALRPIFRRVRKEIRKLGLETRATTVADMSAILKLLLDGERQSSSHSAISV
ncbi:hypothetical protein M8818_005337 [Zalaria obscura]|uniref:Uncharacterized protein n=1 Tax=Zalaria obscura TaxID=2024903 RepID=A0ACC3S9U1_9PEZI